MLSLEAFPRGFPTGLSHVPPWCESILGLKVEAEQGKQVSLELTDIWGTLGMVAGQWSSSLLSCRDRLLLSCDGNAGYSFPTSQGKDPSSRARRRKRGSSGCRRSPQERREELQGRAIFPKSPRCLSPYQRNLFSLLCLDFQAEDLLTALWHLGQPCGKAS